MSTFIFFDILVDTDTNTNVMQNVNETTDTKIRLADVTQAEQTANMLTTYSHSHRYTRTVASWPVAN